MERVHGCCCGGRGRKGRQHITSQMGMRDTHASAVVCKPQFDDYDKCIQSVRVCVYVCAVFVVADVLCLSKRRENCRPRPPTHDSSNTINVSVCVCV